MSKLRLGVRSPRFGVLILHVALAGLAAGCGDDSASTSGSGASGAAGGSGGAGAAGGSTTSTAGSGGTGGAGAAGGAGGEGGAGAAGGTGGAGGGVGGGGACDGYVGQATPAEVALSPYSDEEAEQLALEASGKVVAPKHVYERIHTDLLLIRAQYPEVQGIGAMKSWALNQMLMGFDAQVQPSVEDGTYTDWACPNDLYDMTNASFSSFALLNFAHRLNIPALAKEYSMFTGVQYAEPNGLFGDGNDVCASIEAEKKYYYVFDAGSGDCQAGCINHSYWGFSTEGSPVQITALGEFSNQDLPPAWFNALSECANWL